MQISRLWIEGFGQFHHFEIADLPNGLVVFHGPNEAGKSTLLSFLSFVLFGKERARNVYALAGGRPGGRVDLGTGADRVSVERYDGQPPLVLDAVGSSVGDDAVLRVLGGTDRRLFQSVYAFSLADLMSLDGLGDEATRERLFAGALAGAGRSVDDARRSVARERDAISRPRGDCALRRRTEAIKSLDSQLDEARRRSRTVSALRLRLEELDATRAKLEAEIAQASGRAVRAASLCRAWPHFVAMRDARRELATLSGLPVLEPSRAEELRNSQREFEAAVQDRQVAEEAFRNLCARVSSIQVDSRWLGIRGALDLLADGIDDVVSRQTSIDDSRATKVVRRRAVDEQLRRIGVQSEADLEGIDRSLARLSALREAAAKARQRHSLEDEAAKAAAAVELARVQASQQAEVLRTIVLDEVAERMATRVDGLFRDLSSIGQDEVRLSVLSKQADQARRELERLRSDIDEPSSSEARAPDPAREAEFRAQHDAWRDASARSGIRVRAAESTLAGAKQTVEAIQSRLTALRIDSPAIDAAPAFRGLEGREGSARVAEASGRQSLEAAEQAQAAARRYELQLGFGQRDISGLLERLTDAEAARGTELSKQCDRCANAEEPLRRQAEGNPPDVSAVSETDARTRLEAIEECFAAIEVRDRLRSENQAAQARAGDDVPGVSPNLAWVVIGLSVVWALLGVLATLTGAIFVGPIAFLAAVPVFVVGLYLRKHLRRRTGEASLSPSPELERAEQEVERRARAAGFEPNVDLLAVGTARRRAQDALQAAARAAEVRRVHKDWETARQRLDNAQQAFDAWARSMDIPESVTPSDLTMFLATVRLLRDARQRAEDARQGGLTNGRMAKQWRDECLAMASRLGIPASEDAMELLRSRIRTAEVALAEQQSLERELANTQDALARATAEVSAALEEAASVATSQRRLEEAARALGVPLAVSVADSVRWLQERATQVLVRERCRSAEEEAERVAARISAWTQELDLVREAMALNGGREQILEEARRRCVAAADLRQRWIAARGALEGLQQAVALAEEGAKAASVRIEDAAVWERTWQAERSAAGLPAAVRPEDLESVLEMIAVATKTLEELRELEAAESAREAHVVSWVAEARRVLSMVEIVPGDGWRDVIDSVRAAMQTAHATSEAARRRTELEADRDAQEGVLSQLQLRADGLAARLRDKLSACGCEDLVGVDAAAARWSQVRALELKAERAGESLVEALGKDVDDVATMERLESGELRSWEVEEQSARQEALELGQRRDQCIREQGQIESDIHAIGTANDIAEKDIARGVEAAGREAELQQLAILALADQLLAKTMDEFRKRHAPAVFRVASEQLERATGGMYSEVEASDDYSDIVVYDASGRSRPTETLSRGTKDLLYFTLRLGLAREQRPGGVVLPLIIDDVFVNLDPERAEGVARVVAAESELRQVLLMTCRPETVALMSQIVPGARVVDLQRYQGRSGPVAPVVRAERRTRGAGKSADTSVDELVVTALSGAEQLLLRAEIVEKTGLDEAAVASALGRLRENGSVRTEGQKRGMRYGLAT